MLAFTSRRHDGQVIVNSDGDRDEVTIVNINKIAIVSLYIRLST